MSKARGSSGGRADRGHASRREELASERADRVVARLDSLLESCVMVKVRVVG